VLHEQEERHARLGEILVSRGLLSGMQLAQALAEQQGVELDPTGLETTLRPAQPEEPIPRSGRLRLRVRRHARAGRARDPPNTRRCAGTVWHYSASRAAAADIARKSPVETFGFEPTRWDHTR
jgi:hypothetical protein